MINPKDVTKKLQELVTGGYSGVVLLDRAIPVTAEELRVSSVWMLSGRVRGRHRGVIPAKDLRKLIWSENENRWFKEGRGVAYAAQHPDTGEVVAGLGVLVSREVGNRMESLTKSDVYAEPDEPDEGGA